MATRKVNVQSYSRDVPSANDTCLNASMSRPIKFASRRKTKCDGDGNEMSWVLGAAAVTVAVEKQT